MQVQSNTPAQTTRRPVRYLDVDASDLSAVANGIEDIYDGLDVIVVRGAFDAAALAEAGERLDREAERQPWSRPNIKMPVADVQLLGTDTPATPTFAAPRGTTLDAYLASAAAHAQELTSVFKPGFDPASAFPALLGRVSGGRPTQLARASDGRPFAPFTIRRLVAGTGILVHHDYHYGLDVYQEMGPHLDTGTLVSFVATLRAPQAGGELVVYGATSDATDLPRLADGFSYDLQAIEARYESVHLTMKTGDLFLLAAGRCLHRVERIAGAQARITMGGFLALDRSRERVLYWS